MKHLKKPNLLKTLCGTISVWDLLYSILENGNLQLFSKELSTIIINLKSISKSLKLVSECESNPIDVNQMVKKQNVSLILAHISNLYFSS